MRTANDHLAVAQNSNSGITDAQKQLTNYRVLAFGSIIGAIILWFGGNKFINKLYSSNNK